MTEIIRPQHFSKFDAEDDPEFRAFMKRDRGGTEDTANKVQPFDVIDARELTRTKAPARKWHIPLVIPGNEVSFLASDGGSGKTTLALQLAVATVDKRRTWLGETVREGNVLYVAAEDDRDELHFRLEETLAGQRLPDAPHTLNILAVPSKDKLTDPTLFATSRDGQLVLTPLWHRLVRHVEQNDTRLLIIDALADVNATNENDKASTSFIIRHLRHLALKHDCAVLLLLHPSLSGMQDGRGYSGNTFWNAGPKARLYLKAVRTRGGEDTGLRSLELVKANRAPMAWKKDLEWRDGRYAVVTKDAADRLRDRGEAEAVFLSLLGRFNKQGRNVKDTKGTNYAPALFAREDEGKEIGKARLEDAMRSLFAKEVIRLGEVKDSGGRKRQVLEVWEAETS